METQNVNATLECIKETTTITQRIITNVCTGQVTNIPIGFWDFVLGGIMFLLIGAVCFAFLAFLYKMITEIK